MPYSSRLKRNIDYKMGKKLRGDCTDEYEFESRFWAWEKAEKHRGARHILEARYKKTVKERGFVEANRELLETTSRIELNGVDRSAAMSEAEIDSLADLRAKHSERIVKSFVGDFWGAVSGLVSYVRSFGLEYPTKCDQRPNEDEEEFRSRMYSSTLRIVDKKWWRRKIRTQNIRMVEAELIRSGYVGGDGIPYCSNWSIARVEFRKKQAREILKNLEGVNQDGDVINLLDASDSSVANPNNRFAEMIVRVKGMESVAVENGLVGLFFTLTCPSRFHARSGGNINKNWLEGELSPVDGMKYLNGVWQRIRARWAKHGLRVLGMRVAEPHKDGTPHFHCWVFCENEEKGRVIEIFGDAALRDSPAEPGARQHRWSVVEIDPAKGSAAGYVAKYLSKNIVGARGSASELGYSWDADTGAGKSEFTGVDAKEGARRVSAWASAWGIRQFAFIGGASVGVWRELRRLAVNEQRERGDRVVEVDALIREAAHVAGASDWAGYMMIQGGVWVTRRVQEIGIFTMEATGMLSRYAEAVTRTIGVTRSGCRAVVTRLDVWTIRQAQYGGV